MVTVTNKLSQTTLNSYQSSMTEMSAMIKTGMSGLKNSLDGVSGQLQRQQIVTEASYTNKYINYAT